MATFSDGVDVDASSSIADYSSFHDSDGDVRELLQNLLDSKEKQLQQAGELGQQLLTQRVELEERIRQLQELDLEGDDGDDLRDHYRELTDTIKAWDAENEQLSSIFLPKHTNGFSTSPPAELSRGEVERTMERAKASANGTIAAQSSRRAKNAAHRADDVEFAFEIGSGLLSEVRRLQSLLAERDKNMQDLKEERDDLEKTIESLREALRQQEQSSDKFREENWNLEVTLQELRTQLAESQAATQRLESEQKRLTKLLTTTREAVDLHKNEAERHQNAYEELKAKHETDVAQARRHAAGLQRDKSDLQQTVDTLKAEVTKVSKRLPRFGTPFTPNGALSSAAQTPALDEDDIFSTGGASTNNRKKVDNSALFPPEGFDNYDSDPEDSPSRPFIAPNHPTNEIEALQQRLAHAQRQINTLKGSLQREKELRIEYKRKLDSTPGPKSDDDEEPEGEEEEMFPSVEESKPKARLTSFRVGKTAKGARRGRGGMTLLQRLAAQSPGSEYADEDDLDPSQSVPPLPLKPGDEEHALELAEDDDEDSELQRSPSTRLSSKRTSVDGMDPAFANVMRRSSSGRSGPHGASPLRHSILSRSARGKPHSRRNRGGAAFQEARPPSFAVEPEALANELGQLGFSTLENTFELPEPTRELVEIASQTDSFEELSVPQVIVQSPTLPQVAPNLPSVSEMGIQVDPEPAFVPSRFDASLQTDEEPAPPAPVHTETAIQHEDLTPRPLLVSAGISTDPLPEPEPMPLPEPIPVSVTTNAVQTEPEAVLVRPALSTSASQTNSQCLADVDVQTTPEVAVIKHDVVTQTSQWADEVDTVPEPVVIKHDADVQTSAAAAAAAAVDAATPVAKYDADTQTPSPVIADLPAVSEEIVIKHDADTQTPAPVPLSEAHTQTIAVFTSEADVQVQSEMSTPRMPLRLRSFADSVVGNFSGDSTITSGLAHLAAEQSFDDDDVRTETGTIAATDMDDFVDARQTPLLTPTESTDDFLSIMTVTDNDFSDSDDESIRASRLSSRQVSASGSTSQLPSPGAPVPSPRTYESVGVSAELIEENIPEEPTVSAVILPAPKPESKETSIQTDEWLPPQPASPAPPSPAPTSSPTLFRVGPPSQQFQFISPPSSAGPTTSSQQFITTPSTSATNVRDTASSLIPSLISRPRTSHSDRRQSIESTLSSAREEALARSRTPSTVTSATVDKSRPPMMIIPPPPRQPPPGAMPPPAFIPEKRQPKTSTASQDVPPPRPSSPPPPELIQRATTPTFGQILTVPGARPFGLRHHPSSVVSSQSGIRQPPSTQSFHSVPTGRPVLSSPSSVAQSIREREGRGVSTTSLTSGGHSLDSQRSSVSSEHLEYDQTPQRLTNVLAPAPRGPPGGATDPTIIHAITQTMIGEFLYKYTRKTIGKGHGERRHKRFFWVHPYTRTLYWSSADPGSSNVSESSAKSAYVEAVRFVIDPNPVPPGIYQYSIIVSTPQREMKFTAPTKERHDIWLSALQYLLTRPDPNPVSSPSQQPNGLTSPVSLEAELPDNDGQQQRPKAFASPQSQRSVRTNGTGVSADSWNSTPRGHRSASQLSHHRSTLAKRSGTPAAEYLRWNGPDTPYSPSRDFEHVPSPNAGELDFELHEDTLSDEGFQGLENVRACCDGRHTVGPASKEHHHHHPPASAPPPQALNNRIRDHLDPNPQEITRPISPAWSFRSRAGSTHSTEGTGFFSRFGTRRSARTTASEHTRR
ncbi:uncharacterized protein PHACADRAFT_251900 [Phanerochaete carnosa HHB-10118-sp]|uniref:PH domain-containing protein n=1 Tax=Phanerochaete carnosa (strain HHB-10118-sp) TaxID=650164 RepID=K5WFA2_PHACS|nr:uncharacterized protein PHACADRAFT_251900 [Phanerochaete carnosa HHB-10118-sp]EKM57970.1 hypothetical protein PHACADRAFT_251900 [Phanerochaete carnosa HHB-10118-sp]